MRAGVILRTFGPFLRPQWPGCVLAGLLAAASAGVALLKPWPLKYLFDEVLLPAGAPGGQDVQRVLVLIVGALVVITLLDSLISAARSYTLTVVGERVSAAIRTKLYDHLQRLHSTIEGIREMLTTAIQVNLGMISLNETEVTKKLAGWAAIIAVPTMIAGIYGMNFDHMPELRWELGYPAVLVVMAALCASLYRYFKKVGWL